MQVKTYLADLRTRLGYTQVQMAARLKTSQSTVSKTERGILDPPASALVNAFKAEKASLETTKFVALAVKE